MSSQANDLSRGGGGRTSRPYALLVEDETSLIELIRYNLDREGYEVRVATDGEEAILLIEERLPDIVRVNTTKKRSRVAHRVGEVVGTHTLRFFSPYDEIKLTHNAFNRSGFAAGAIEAAKFVVNKKGIFTMNDLIPV